MNKLMKTGSLAAAGVLTTALVAWQAPALADHGADDAAVSVSSHRHGDDDGPGHDRGDDRGHRGHRGHHGHHGHGQDDGAGHDRGDDHGGRHGHGQDDGPGHDRGDDHGGRHG